VVVIAVVVVDVVLAVVVVELAEVVPVTLEVVVVIKAVASVVWVVVAARLDKCHQTPPPIITKTKITINIPRYDFGCCSSIIPPPF